MCLYPKIIKNKKYVANKKNGGNIPPVNDERVKYVPAGCGKCMECRKQKSREWQVRLSEELRENKDKCYFVTMTFSDEQMDEIDRKVVKEHKKIRKKLKEQGKLKVSKRNDKNFLKGYNRDNEIARYSVRRFTENWRKEFGHTIRHWLVTELGTTSTERLHIHGILWHNNTEDITRKWKYGKVWYGKYVNEKTINYIIKYLSKPDKKHKEYTPKMFVSHGIGKGYLNRKDKETNKYKENETTNEAYRTRTGLKLALPIYYRNKIYSEDEREKLWIQKLDKEERWVNGRKVDISKGDQEYWKVLKEERIINEIRGYGDNKINWERKKYEQEKRNLKRIERIKKLYG